MTKQLSDWDFNDIRGKFAGKLYTFTPIASQTCGIGIAVANESGYCPVSRNLCDPGPRYDDAKIEANRLNEKLGQTVDASLDIVASSMANSKPRLSTWRITRTQAVWEKSIWEIEAKDEEEAREKFDNGGGTLVSKEIEGAVNMIDSETEVDLA